MFWKVIISSFFIFFLTSCQTSHPRISADVIIENAHGGGSVLHFNNSETILATGGWSGFIRLWNIPDGAKLFSWKAHDGEVTGLYFTGADKNIISTGHDGFINVWSTRGVLLHQINTLHTIRSLAVDEQHDLIITGHIDGIVRIWQLTTLSLLKQRKQHNNSVIAVAFSSESEMVASSSSDGNVMLWPKSKPSIKLPSPFSDIRALTFTKNGQVLLGGGWFNLYRWSLNDHKMQTLDTEHRGIIRNMELLDNDTTLATISRQTDSAVLFLDPKTGAVKKRFQSHDLCGVDVTISRNQNFMATTSDDASVRLWWLNSSSN